MLWATHKTGHAVQGQIWKSPLLDFPPSKMIIRFDKMFKLNSIKPIQCAFMWAKNMESSILTCLITSGWCDEAFNTWWSGIKFWTNADFTLIKLIIFPSCSLISIRKITSLTTGSFNSRQKEMLNHKRVEKFEDCTGDCIFVVCVCCHAQLRAESLSLAVYLKAI